MLDVKGKITGCLAVLMRDWEVKNQSIAPIKTSPMMVRYLVECAGPHGPCGCDNINSTFNVLNYKTVDINWAPTDGDKSRVNCITY